MKKIKNKNKYLLVSLVIVLAVFLTTAHAFATDIFWVSGVNVQVGDQFQSNLFINTASEDVNAIQGKIIVPAGLLKIKEIKIGNSIVNLWVPQSPSFKKIVTNLDANTQELSFAGVVPGGYTSSKGLILSLVLQAEKEGSAEVTISDVKVLLNDGKGTQTTTRVSKLQLNISKQTKPEVTKVVEKQVADIPEVFVPKISADPSIFKGKWFLVFSTQDKVSGIDHYEVQEGNGSYVVAVSPYLLEDQNLDKTINIKAVNTANGVRIVTLPATRPIPWYKNYSKLIYGLIAIVIILLLAIILTRKLRKNNINVEN